MAPYFITGNKNKFLEAIGILDNIEQLDIDLVEIQSIDAKEIISSKLNEAKKYHDGSFIVEDTSLYLECLNGLPGPLIKWFLEKLGNEGIYDICAKYGNFNAVAKTFVGYNDGNDIKFFEGILEGKIVEPKIKNGFGWDALFMPNGKDKSMAELSREEKNEISMRGTAFKKLKMFLDQKK